MPAIVGSVVEHWHEKDALNCDPPPELSALFDNRLPKKSLTHVSAVSLDSLCGVTCHAAKPLIEVMQ